MRKYFRPIILVGLVLCLAANAQALLDELGVNPLRLELVGRPLGLGGAYTGLADDAAAVYYNPGGLAWVRGIALTVKDYNNATAIQAYPTGYNSSIGLALSASNITGIPFSGGTAATSGNTIVLGYGAKMDSLPLLPPNEVFQRIGWGLTVKNLSGEILRRTGLPDRSASGWDMDFGLLWKGTEWWSAGLCAQNFLPAGALGGGTIKWDSGPAEGIPFGLNLGAAARVIGDLGTPYFLEGRDLIVSGDLDFSRVGPLLRLGGEWAVNKTYYCRGGLMSQARAGGSTTNLNLGFGYRTADWGIDLATYRQPQTEENQLYFSFHYFPKEWIVLKKLDVEKPQIVLEAALEKISIEDNVVTYDDRIEILGKVKTGVEVYINDLRAFTDADNGFKVTVPLNIGKNLVVVEARYNGEKKTWKYKILRQQKVAVSEEKTVQQELAKAKTPEQKEVLTKQAEDISTKKQKVEELVTLGIVEVSPGQEFRLDATLTRGELATWIAKATGFTLPKVEKDIFPDVKKNNPLAPYIKLVVDVGLLAPFADGTFRPEAPVSKEEGDKLFKMLRKAQR